jgi:undecaprenyl-diphosphatase
VPEATSPRRLPLLRLTAAALVAALLLALAGPLTAAGAAPADPPPSVPAAGPALVPLADLAVIPTRETAAASAESSSEGDTPTDVEAADAEMTWWKAAILGVVEGVTEYLPISSTGHLLVTQRILGIGEHDATKDAADSYAIAIQFGAIVAVLVLYRRRVESLVRGLLGRDAVGRRLLISLACATAPAVAVALVFERPIKDNLLGPWPVVAAWAVGGIAVLFVAPRVRAERPGLALEQLRPKQALIIGLVQVIAMWPGTSRSLVTLLAGLAVGLTLSAAVEFSFLLGFVTLGGATLYEGAKNGSTMIDAYGVIDPLIGLLFAFLAAVVAIRWMVDYLQTRSLAIFGWERLGAAALTVVLLVSSVI